MSRANEAGPGDGQPSRARARIEGLFRLLRTRAGGSAQLEPTGGVTPREGAGAWTAVNEDPQFALAFEGGLPRGLCRLELRLHQQAPVILAKLYIDDSRGFREDCSRSWHVRSGMRLQAQIYISMQVRALRFDPTERVGPFEIEHLRIVPLGLWQTVRHLLRERYGWMLARFRRQRTEGIGLELSQHSYEKLIAYDEPGLDEARAEIEAHQGRMANPPLFSVIMPTFDTPLEYLDRAIESVRAQTWPHWELCIADDRSRDARVPARLREWAARDPRIRVVERDKNGGISAASNSALAIARGNFVAFLDHDDELAPLALYYVAAELDRDPGLDLIYTDEDKITTRGERYDPHFKTVWNPELLYAQNYIAHLAVYRRTLVDRVGGLRSACDGSQDHDLALRIAAATAAERIRHIPVILYHWRAIPGSTALSAGEKSYPHNAALRALRDRFADEPGVQVQTGLAPLTYWVRFPVPDPAPKVSILIPTRDGYAHAHRCIDSLLEGTQYPDFEIVLMDNQSRDPRTLRWFEECRRHPRIRVVLHDAPFNFSRINNAAVREATGEVVVLLNDDTELITPGWLTEMVSLAVRPDVGAVGAKLYYPDGTIQHAGVALGIGGVAGHTHYHLPADAPGYMGRLKLRQSMSAVTAACLAVSREKYRAVGGLDETNLAIAFNDIDFCLKLSARGWRSVWTPFAELVHYESKSRGAEDNPEKVKRFNSEAEYMLRRWPRELAEDPYFHRCWSRQSQQYGLDIAPRPYWPWKDREAPAAAGSAQPAGDVGITATSGEQA